MIRVFVLWLASCLEESAVLKEHTLPPTIGHNRGLRAAALGFVAVVFLMAGLFIAAGLDFTPGTAAQMGTNVSQTGMFPVVERDGELESPFVAVVDRVKDAVVNISARSLEAELPWWHRQPFYSTSSGSGFFFREDGYVLTNNHVVAQAEELTVRTAAGYEYDAILVGRDPETDLAVLRIQPEERVTVIPFGDSDALKVGDWAIAIGNPFPQHGLDRTVTVGVISAKGRANLSFGRETPQYQNYIQTDASINPGNSGGPLLNLRGEVIGVNAAISSPTGSSVGIGFAVPINIARSIVPDLIADGEVSRGWLGVWLGGDVTEREARRQGLDRVRGVVIDSVLDDSPAKRAGIEPGDIVTAFNNQEVESQRQFVALVSTVREGDVVPIQVHRDGVKLDLTTAIADRAMYEAATRQDGNNSAARTWMGMELIPFLPEVAQALSIEYVDGLYVRRVYPGSPADNASITRGTIILSVEDVSVKSLEDLDVARRNLPRDRRKIPLIVQGPDGTIERKVIRFE